MRPPPSLVYWVLAMLVPTCGCLDIPGPVPDGQLYRCTMSERLDAERLSAERQLAEVRAELTDVREHFGQHRVETPTLVAAKAERETAEAIAHWLAGQGLGFSKAAADIRSGAFKRGPA